MWCGEELGVGKTNGVRDIVNDFEEFVLGIVTANTTTPLCAVCDLHGTCILTVVGVWGVVLNSFLSAKWGSVPWNEVMWDEVVWDEVMWGEVVWDEVMWGEVMWGEVM